MMTSLRRLFGVTNLLFFSICAIGSPTPPPGSRLAPPPPLLAYQDLEKQLNENVDKLLYEWIPRISVADFDNSQQKEKTIESIKAILRTLDSIRQSREVLFVLRGEALSQVNGEAEVMMLILGKLREANPHLAKEDQKRIELLKRDLQLKSYLAQRISALPLEPSHDYPKLLVIVTTVRTDGKEERNLTIYYVPQALYGSPREKENIKSFGPLSSPAKQMIPLADYFVWAGRADNITPLTNVKDVEVREQRNEVTLVVK